MALTKREAERLARLHAIAVDATTKRNEAIRAARASGGGVREIARAVGLTPATVHYVVNGRRRAPHVSSV